MIGKGSYAEVFLATDNITSEKVAIKRFYTRNNDIKKSFSNELKICKIIQENIRCPYIVNILDTYSDFNYTYLVMEYAPHGDLETFIDRSFKKKKGITEKIIDRVILQVNEAIDCLHCNNIIHRDIKSSNILIFDSKTIKISDFGVSKLLENNIFARSSIGTPYYMSPAIVRGEKYSFNVDYWALGILIYKMITNKYPFEAKNLPQLVKKIKDSKYDTYLIPKKYKKLISDLLNPSYDKELIEIDKIKRNSEIKDFISYNCNTFINSPTNNYFRDKLKEPSSNYNPYFNEDVNEEEENKLPPLKFHKEYFPEEIISQKKNNEIIEKSKQYKPNVNLSPINQFKKNILKQNDIITKIPMESVQSNYNISKERYYNEFHRINRYESNQNKQNEYEANNKNIHNINRVNRVESNDFKKLKPIEKYNEDNIENKMKKYRYNNVKRPNNFNPYSKKYPDSINYPRHNFLQPINNYDQKKNKNFLGKNFIEENKQNIRRINKINNIIKYMPYNVDQLRKVINETSLKKAPKQYLNNLKKAYAN